MWLCWDTGPLKCSERICPYLAEHACMEDTPQALDSASHAEQDPTPGTVMGGAVLGSHLFEGWPLATSGILKNTDDR